MKIQQRGFTLTEILTVMVIVAVLAVVAIPRFTGQKEKAIVAEAVSMLTAIRQGEAAYRLQNPDYKGLTSTSTDDDWGMIGLDRPTDTTKFTYGVDQASGLATATRTGTGGKTITLTAAGGWGGTYTDYIPGT